MRKTCLLLAALVLFATQAAAQEKETRVMLVLGATGSHDALKMAGVFDGAFKKAGGFKVTRLQPAEDKKGAGSEHLAKLADLKPGDTDVVVFYTVGHKLGELQERALENFVEQGGGVVAIHCASASFGGSKTWLNLIGGRFAGHAPGLYELDVVMDAKDHPITKGVAPFKVKDEEYNHTYAMVKRNVLASFKSRPEKSKGKDNDILWTRDVGKGRVVYTGLGHGAEAWNNPSFQKLVLQSIAWAGRQPREIKVD